MIELPPTVERYLGEQVLGRLATVDAAGRPHVVPVRYRFDPDLVVIDIGGRRTRDTQKWRNIQRAGYAAFTVDDVLPPWTPRGLQVRGRAEALPTGGRAVADDFANELIRIHIERLEIWGALAAASDATD